MLGEKGVLAYTLGNKRCRNFHTCGPNGDAAVGEAIVNSNLMSLFSEGQYQVGSHAVTPHFLLFSLSLSLSFPLSPLWLRFP